MCIRSHPPNGPNAFEKFGQNQKFGNTKNSSNRPWKLGYDPQLYGNSIKKLWEFTHSILRVKNIL